MKSVRELISEGSLAPAKIKIKYISNAMFENYATLQYIMKGQKSSFKSDNLYLALAKAEIRPGLYFQLLLARY